MKFVCVVAEYNPLHLGHVRHLAASKSLGDATLVVMGGDFCQRGFSAVLDKYTRAEEAVSAGADVVVELPTVYAVSCAEQFARGAMRLVDLLPDSVLSFGSECGDASLLQATASLIDDPTVDAYVKASVSEGTAYPRARAEAIARFSREHNISIADVTQPNNILALEYIRAAQRPHDYFTLRRTDDYHSDAPALSSGYVRKALREGLPYADLVPDCVRRDLARATTAQDVLYLAALRAHSKASFEDLLDNAEGLSNRIWQCAMEANTLDEAVNLAMTKRYTRARVGRLFTAALLDLRRGDLVEADAAPAYFNVLAVKKGCTDLISHLGRYAEICTTQRELAVGTPTQRIDARAHEIYRLLHATDVSHSVRVVE